MPNHVINRLSFDCPEERLKQILSEICYDDSAEVETTGIGTIDFNKITPMPPSLDIEDGSNTTHGINLYLTAINPSVNYFGTEKMAPEEFEALAEKLNGHRHFFPHKTTLSSGEIAECTKYRSADELVRLGKIAVENLMNYGATTWYDWRTRGDTWNTKWNSYSPSYPWSESLYFSAANSSNLCIRLLCAEYLFYQLSENKETFSKIKHSLEALSPNARALQLSYVLSDLVFHVRTSRVIKLKKDEIEEISDWLIKKLSNDLPICSDGEQKLALLWLHDCEVCSNCKLHLALAETVNDPEIKTRIYSEVISEAGRDLTKADYERDISENATLYLIAIDNLYGENAEIEFLKGIIEWHVFETATEPALKDYAFSKWHKACILAQRQIYILEIFVSQHPSATKAKEWLEKWKPRLQDIETDCE